MSALRPIAAAAFFFLASTVLAAPLEPPRANEKWVTLQVDEFRIVSSVSPGATLDIARDLLRMRSAIGQLTQLKVRSALPTRVFIFPNERRFGPYRDAVLQRKTENISGVFAQGENGNFILLRSDSEDVDRIVYHELTHYFVRNTTSGLPLWFSEGLAEYYSTFKTTRDAVQIGRAVPEHIHWLRREPLIPLRELFAIGVDSPAYNEGMRQGVFYAESWALVHYLMTDPQRRPKLGEFLRLLGLGKDVETAFNTAFGMKFEELEKQLRAYVRGFGFKYASYGTGQIAIDEPPAPAPMTHDAVLYETGHLLANAGRATAETAERFLGAALQANPQHARAYADVARLHLLANRRAEADAALAKAVQFAGYDAEIYLVAGTSILARFAGQRSDTISVDDMKKAHDLLKRATELDPRSALAWASLGATYMALPGDIAPGIAALEKSLALAPSNDEAMYYLMQLYGRAERYDDA
ncbi:MAG TPA: DUF1570 domain-containing protein, partial [Thermoanaerobaculia bacterium]|nr:DUF1570 domain-containing protein [Thermoanaerobaculia bacterium]